MFRVARDFCLLEALCGLFRFVLYAQEFWLLPDEVRKPSCPRLCGPLKLSPPDGVVFILTTRSRGSALVESFKFFTWQRQSVLSPCRNRAPGLPRPSSRTFPKLRSFQKHGESLSRDRLLVPGYTSTGIKVGCAGKAEVTRVLRSRSLAEAAGSESLCSTRPRLR